MASRMKWINGRNIIAFSGSWAYLRDGKEKNAARTERKRGGMFAAVEDRFINTSRPPNCYYDVEFQLMKLSSKPHWGRDATGACQGSARGEYETIGSSRKV
jgi:hypothetical protein